MRLVIELDGGLVQGVAWLADDPDDGPACGTIDAVVIDYDTEGMPRKDGVMISGQLAAVSVWDVSEASELSARIRKVAREAVTG